MVDIIIESAPYNVPLQSGGVLTPAWSSFFQNLIKNQLTLISYIQANDSSVGNKINIITDGTVGNIPVITSDGNLEDGISIADNVAEASEITAIQATVGGNSINLVALNTALTTMRTEINAIVSTVNDIIQAEIDSGQMRAS